MIYDYKRITWRQSGYLVTLCV